MDSKMKVLAGLLAAGLAVGVTACSSSDAAEKIAEKAAEQQTGGDVDIDSDGSVKYTDDEGNTVDMGTGSELPKDWPDELKPPDSVKITTASTSTTNGEKNMYVLATSSDSFDDLYNGVKSQLESAGFEITNDSNTSIDGGGYAGIDAENDEFTANVIIAADDTSGDTTLTFNLTAKNAE